jgi:hypothetical protein
MDTKRSGVSIYSGKRRRRIECCQIYFVILKTMGWSCRRYERCQVPICIVGVEYLVPIGQYLPGYSAYRVVFKSRYSLNRVCCCGKPASIVVSIACRASSLCYSDKLSFWIVAVIGSFYTRNRVFDYSAFLIYPAKGFSAFRGNRCEELICSISLSIWHFSTTLNIDDDIRIFILQ